jgi:hypothetical protein
MRRFKRLMHSNLLSKLKRSSRTLLESDFMLARSVGEAAVSWEPDERESYMAANQCDSSQPTVCGSKLNPVALQLLAPASRVCLELAVVLMNMALVMSLTATTQRRLVLSAPPACCMTLKHGKSSL